MAKFGHKLPAVLIPDDDICVQVAIPNHPDYIALFLRAVRLLETQRMYERDETMEGAKIVAEQWRDRTVTPLIETVAQGLPCADERSDCLSYPAYAGFIHYFPDNPYDSDTSAPPGYLIPAWWRWGNVQTVLPDYIDDFVNHQVEQFTGYKNNDAICWISSLLSNNWLAWLNNGYVYPAIEIEVSGSGTANITLLSFPFGSRAIIEVDEAPNPLDILSGGIFDPGAFVVDTARDLLSFPPEEYPINVIPIDIPTEGDHTIYILFLPVINPGLSEELIGFGGGLRSVELCNGLRPRNTPPPEPPPPLEGVTELKPIFKFTPDCGLEVRLVDQNGDIVEDYKPVEGWLENAGDCFGGNMATQAEITQGVVDALEISAARFLSGQAGNIAGGVCIDENGTITVTGSGGVVDDPATAINEAKGAKMGGAIAVAKGIEAVWDKIDSLYGATNAAPTTPLGTAQNTMKLLFQSDATAMDFAVSAYYTYRDTNPRFLYDAPAGFGQYLYCKGSNKQSAIRFMIEVVAFTQTKNDAMVNFILALSDEFFSYYYNIGVTAPSSAYADASCEPSPTETLNILAVNTDYTTITAWKINHRLKFTCTGSFVDSNAPQRLADMFWYVDNLGVLNSRIGTIVFTQANQAVDRPTSNQVPYNAATHKYEFTLDTKVAGTIKLGLANPPMTAPLTGSISVIIEDLGEFIG